MRHMVFPNKTTYLEKMRTAAGHNCLACGIGPSGRIAFERKDGGFFLLFFEGTEPLGFGTEIMLLECF